MFDFQQNIYQIDPLMEIMQTSVAKNDVNSPIDNIQHRVSIENW